MLLLHFYVSKSTVVINLQKITPKLRPVSCKASIQAKQQIRKSSLHIDGVFLSISPQLAFSKAKRGTMFDLLGAASRVPRIGWVGELIDSPAVKPVDTRQSIGMHRGIHHRHIRS
jgi:hypothetical protein